MRGLMRTAAVTCLLLSFARYGLASPGSFVYVACSSCVDASHCFLNLYVYDAATSALVTTIPIQDTALAGPSVHGLAISPDGSRVYVSVTIAALPEVVVVDTTRHLLMNSVIFAPAGELAVSHDGTSCSFLALPGLFCTTSRPGSRSHRSKDRAGSFSLPP